MLRQVGTLLELRRKSIFLYKAFKRRKIEYFETVIGECTANNTTGNQLIALLSVPNKKKKKETPWFHAVHSLQIEELEKVLKSIKKLEIITKSDIINFLYTDLESKSTMVHEACRNEGPERLRLLENYGAIHKKDANGLLPQDRDRRINVNASTGFLVSVQH